MIARRQFLSSAAAVGCVAGAAMSPARILAHDPEEILLWPGAPPGRGEVTGSEKIGPSTRSIPQSSSEASSVLVSIPLAMVSIWSAPDSATIARIRPSSRLS